MRLHVVSLPNTETTAKDFYWSPYTMKVRQFCRMMMGLGHEVFLYAGEHNDVKVTEHVICMKTVERLEYFPDRFPNFDPMSLGRMAFAFNVAKALTIRSAPGDILCLTEGAVQSNLIQSFPELIPVEIGVGYEAICTNHRVFESYAWMHYVHGKHHEAYGGFLDEVIPNAYDVYDFPLGNHSHDYMAYVGRLDVRKGIMVAMDVAEEAGVELMVAGYIPNGVSSEILDPKRATFLGSLGFADRAKLMGEARCLIAPTLGIEPFGGSVVEAQLCGTPVITTDWGAFTETVEQGVSGFRCRSLSEFVWSVQNLDDLEWTHDEIRDNAGFNWGTESVSKQWASYFARTTPGGASAPHFPPNRPPER